MTERKFPVGPFALVVAGIFVMIFAFSDPRSQDPQFSGAWLSLNLAFAVPLVLLGIGWWAWKHRKSSRV